MPKITTAEKLGKLKRIAFTKQGHDELVQKLEDLKQSRPGAVAELARARELGDLSENGLYTAAKARLGSIDSQIFRAEMTLKLADIIDESQESGIHIGSKVTVKTDGNTFVYQLVGDTEANPKEFKITQGSPIGSALLGKTNGNKVTVSLPAGDKVFEIIEVS